MLKEDLRLSVSKVKTFDSCGKKFKYTYILKMPRKEQDFLVLGKFCHLVLERFHCVYLNGSNEPYEQVMTRIFKEVKKEYLLKISQEMIKECFSILNEYLKIISTNKEHKLALPLIAAERDFEIRLSDNIVLIGAIDRIQIDKDGILHVADYKTTKNKKYLVDDFAQLETYAYVLMMEDPNIKTIRASYILLKHNFEFITKEFSRDEILLIKDKYIDYAQKIINETEYNAKTSKLCKWCDFIDICEEGRKELNLFNGEVEW